MNKHLIAYVVLVLIILFFANNVLTGSAKGAAAAAAPGPKWTVYGTNGCGWTRKQLEVMDSKNVPYTFVDCDHEDCAGINAFPTLVKPTGEKLVGFNNL